MDPEEVSGTTMRYNKTVFQLEKGLPPNSVVPKLKAKVESMKDKVNFVVIIDIILTSLLTTCEAQGSYGQGKSGNFEGVRESQGKQIGSGKSQGILKYCSLDQLFMHYFHNFCRLLGALPPDLHWGSATVNTAG